jgi:hypothetical protein
MALEELAHVSGADLGGDGGGGGRRHSHHFCQRIHGTSFPKVDGVHVPIGEGVYSNRGVEEAPPSSPGGFVQSSQVNEMNDKSCPNSTMSIHDSSGYAGGAAQIPQANAINDKSHPNSTTNIHDSSGYAGGAAQIPQVNAINDNDKSFTIQPQTSTFLQVMLVTLPKFHRQTQLMTSLPQTSTIHQVSPEAPKFHFFRLWWRRCPNSTGERNQ